MGFLRKELEKGPRRSWKQNDPNQELFFLEPLLQLPHYALWRWAQWKLKSGRPVWSDKIRQACLSQICQYLSNATKITILRRQCCLDKIAVSLLTHSIKRQVLRNYGKGPCQGNIVSFSRRHSTLTFQKRFHFENSFCFVQLSTNVVAWLIQQHKLN